jgi:hypothetical protein
MNKPIAEIRLLTDHTSRQPVTAEMKKFYGWRLIASKKGTSFQNIITKEEAIEMISKGYAIAATKTTTESLVA